MAYISDLLLSAPEVASKAWSALDDVFSEEPVPLKVFIEDKKFLGNPPLSPVQFAAVQHAERVYYPEHYLEMGKEWDYWADPVRMVNYVTCLWAKGSGKDHCARIMGMRIAYLLICLKNPQAYFGIPQQDTIHMLNVASSSQQASQAYFTPIVRAVKHGWFKDRCEPKPGAGIIVWDKNVEQISGHSDAETQEGLNLILGVADEVDAFKSAAELARYHSRNKRAPSKSAESILKLIQTSAETRFPGVFKNVRISYPRYKGSTIELLAAEGHADVQRDPEHSQHYVSGPLATWEVNPRIKGKEVFAEAYRKNPELAAAMYECRPTSSQAGYFRQMSIFDQCVVGDPENLTFDYRLKDFVSPVTGTTTSVWEPEYTFSPEFKPAQGALYSVHGDLAITKDRAGVCVSHVSGWEVRNEKVYDEDGVESERRVSLPIVTVDALFGFEADLGESPPREIQIRWVRDLVFRMVAKGFRIGQVSYDSYQSQDSLQTLSQHGIPTARASTDLSESHWQALRDVASCLLYTSDAADE